MPQHELLACAQCGCFAFSCFEDFAIRVQSPQTPQLVGLPTAVAGNDLVETGSATPASTSSCQHRMTEIQRGTNRGVRSGPRGARRGWQREYADRPVRAVHRDGVPGRQPVRPPWASARAPAAPATQTSVALSRRVPAAITTVQASGFGCITGPSGAGKTEIPVKSRAMGASP